MAPSICSLCLLLAALQLVATASGAAAQAPAPAPSPGACNNATHHAEPLVAYFLTGKELTAKKVKDEPRGVVAQLTTKASDLAPVIPYIVHDGDIIKHGMLDTKRFLRDFHELNLDAAKKGGYGRASIALATQCFANFTSSALDYIKSNGREAPTMEAPSNAVLFTTAHPSKATVIDILDASVDGDTATLSVLLVKEPEMAPEGACHPRQSAANGYHYHFPTACPATEMATDFVLPTAGEQGDISVPGAFSLQIKLGGFPFP